MPDWLRGYQRSWLVGDAVAGVTLAAYLLPSAIGDASLASLPAEAGIYACLFGGLVFWLFCSSRHTSLTVTSAISLLIGSSLGELAGGDTTRYGALAVATALLVGLFGVAAWLVRAGAIVNFVSETVMTGFKTGIALVLVSTQLPKLCGFAGTHGGDFWSRMHHFAAHVGETNGTALLLGLGALGLLLAGKAFLPGRPVAIVVVAGSIAATAWFDLGAHGVKLLGAVPHGLPGITLPAIGWRDANELLPLAFACFLLAAVETAAIGRMFGRKHGYRIDPDREFLAIGGANLAAGLGGGFPVSGGMSQSLVNETGGARTPLSGLVAALLMLVVALWLSGLLADLPQPVLAAIVLTAVTGLFKFAALKRLWRAHRTEFVIAVAALLGVLGSGILRGVLIGAVLSLGMLLRRAARPHVAVLGRIRGLARFSDLDRNPENERIPGLLLFRVEASLLYFNVDFVRDAIWERLRREPAPVRRVVCDLSTSPAVDMAGAEFLSDLHDDLRRQGIQFQVVEARAKVRDMLRLEGLEEKLGHVSRRASLAQAVEDFATSQPEGNR
ncbi:MAG: sulfate permease [Planctomycetes bacterium]|nr:sulfate permease [Planctomycetota bacterium]